MALAATEKWIGGFVIDTRTGGVAVTMSRTGAAWWGGFLRDPDGRLVVTGG